MGNLKLRMKNNKRIKLLVPKAIPTTPRSQSSLWERNCNAKLCFAANLKSLVSKPQLRNE